MAHWRAIAVASIAAIISSVASWQQHRQKPSAKHHKSQPATIERQRSVGGISSIKISSKSVSAAVACKTRGAHGKSMA